MKLGIKQEHEADINYLSALNGATTQGDWEPLP